ncbi:IS3 family transposase [Photorhabdus heterorhabditis]|uniref:IS3 family transposase n=1 Tax=Photorhabdus heterorhabditis TaxID=880156 RepID=UPI0009FA86EC
MTLFGDLNNQRCRLTVKKSECFYLHRFDSTHKLRKAIEEYIYYYNHKRSCISLRLTA